MREAGFSEGSRSHGGYNPAPPGLPFEFGWWDPCPLTSESHDSRKAGWHKAGWEWQHYQAPGDLPLPPPALQLCLLPHRDRCSRSGTQRQSLPPATDSPRMNSDKWKLPCRFYFSPLPESPGASLSQSPVPRGDHGPDLDLWLACACYCIAEERNCFTCTLSVFFLPLLASRVQILNISLCVSLMREQKDKIIKVVKDQSGGVRTGQMKGAR